MQLDLPADGLLPSLDVARWAGLLEQAGLTGPQNPIVLARALAQAGSERILPLAAHGIVPWPAILDDGRLNPPPDVHVLEALVHQRLLDQIDDHARLELEFADRLEAGTVAIVDEPESCDWCARDGRDVPAIVDTPAFPEQRRGVWAFHCRACLDERPGVPLLGTGSGQWLITEADVSAEVRAALAAARRYWLGDTRAPAA
jgi:hypothetical protein